MKKFALLFLLIPFLLKSQQIQNVDVRPNPTDTRKSGGYFNGTFSEWDSIYAKYIHSIKLNGYVPNNGIALDTIEFTVRLGNSYIKKLDTLIYSETWHRTDSIMTAMWINLDTATIGRTNNAKHFLGKDIFDSLKLSNISSGYIPFQNNYKFVNSLIYDTATNISIGPKITRLISAYFLHNTADWIGIPVAQSFKGNGSILTKAGFLVGQEVDSSRGALSGYYKASLYLATGAFGNNKPTGSALSNSTNWIFVGLAHQDTINTWYAPPNVNIPLQYWKYAWFQFPGTDTLKQDVIYCISVQFVGTSTSYEYPLITQDDFRATDANYGNYSSFASIWSANPNYALNMCVNGFPPVVPELFTVNGVSYLNGDVALANGDTLRGMAGYIELNNGLQVDGFSYLHKILSVDSLTIYKNINIAPSTVLRRNGTVVMDGSNNLFITSMTNSGTIHSTGTITSNDAIKGTSIEPTGLTAGKIPYKVASSPLANSPLGTDGTDLSTTGNTKLNLGVTGDSLLNVNLGTHLYRGLKVDGNTSIGGTLVLTNALDTAYAKSVSKIVVFNPLSVAISGKANFISVDTSSTSYGLATLNNVSRNYWAKSILDTNELITKLDTANIGRINRGGLYNVLQDTNRWNLMKDSAWANMQYAWLNQANTYTQLNTFQKISLGTGQNTTKFPFLLYNYEGVQQVFIDTLARMGLGYPSLTSTIFGIKNVNKMANTLVFSNWNGDIFGSMDSVGRFALQISVQPNINFEVLNRSLDNYIMFLGNKDGSQRFSVDSTGLALFYSGMRFNANTVNSNYIADVYPTIYTSASTGASYPFLQNGNLVIQGKSGSAVGDIILATGNTSVQGLVVANNGLTTIGNGALADISQLRLNNGLNANAFSIYNNRLIKIAGVDSNGLGVFNGVMIKNYSGASLTFVDTLWRMGLGYSTVLGTCFAIKNVSFMEDFLGFYNTRNSTIAVIDSVGRLGLQSGVLGSNFAMRNNSLDPYMMILSNKDGTQKIVIDSAGTLFLNSLLRFNYNTINSAYVTSAYPTIYATDNLGSVYPFQNNGNLVLQGRSGSTAGDIVLATGNTAVQRMVIGFNGLTTIGSGTLSTTAQARINNGLFLNATEWYNSIGTLISSKDSVGGEGLGAGASTSQMLLVKNGPLRGNLMDLQNKDGTSYEKTDSSGNKILAGKLSTGGNTVEGAYGVPNVIDSVEVTTTAAVPTTNFNGTSGAHEYRIYGNITVTSGSALGAITVTIGATDAVGAYTITPIASFAATGTGRTYFSPIPVRTASGAITYATTVVGTPTYILTLTAEKVW